MFARILLYSLLVSMPLQAFDPVLNLVTPRGGTRGQEVEVQLHGDRMHEPQELVFYKQGITVKHLEKVDHKNVKATLVIAPEAELGEYPIRLRCKGGVTYMRTFWVGQFPVVNEVEPNNDFSSPQKIPMNHTVHGTAGNEDVDFFQVSAKKGQRISAEIEGMRLGGVFFDPFVAVLDAKRFELATSDDDPLLKQDSFVSVVAPEDGDYVVMVRDSAYEGNNNCRYRLHIGNFSRPVAVYPPAAIPGEEAVLKMVGDPAGDYEIRQVIDGKEGEVYSLYARKDGLLAPSPNPVIVSSLSYYNEVEPNNWWKNIKQEQVMNAPCAFHGIISQKGDSDFFRFKARKGQNLRIRARSRSLGSPLDSVLVVRDAKGKSLGRNDDQGAPDSIIDFKPPADGDYYLQIRDHLGKGGPGYTYRVEVDHRHPRLSATLPVAKRNDSQFRKVICIPKGNRFATVVNIKRENLGCECVFEAGSLPQGVTMQTSKAPKSANNFIAMFEAGGDAPVAGGVYPISIREAKPENPVRGFLKEEINHIEINNVGVFHQTKADQVTIAVIEEAPFHVDLVVPPVPIVRGGTAKLKVNIRRREGFDKPINVVLLWKSPGLGSPTSITIAKGKSEGVYAINANGDAALGKYQICVLGESNTKSGMVRVSSDLVDLEVAEPLLTGSLEMASTIPGKDISMLCKINHAQPIDGQAEIRLLGLPHGVKAEPKLIDAQTKEVIFDLQVAPDAAKGNHNALFCQVLPKRQGHVIPHQTAHGGSLRINPPPPVKKEKKAAGKTPAVKKEAPKKPLSRLEQLRQRNK